MQPEYKLSSEAELDLHEIWRTIASDNLRLANRIEDELFELFSKLGGMPDIGHKRNDLTLRPVLFFPLYSFLVVYRPDTKPIRIIAVLRGRRDLKKILRQRS